MEQALGATINTLLLLFKAATCKTKTCSQTTDAVLPSFWDADAGAGAPLSLEASGGQCARPAVIGGAA